VTHQAAACDAASVHFGPTIIRIDILVLLAAPLRIFPSEVHFRLGVAKLRE